jgi:hypothetical protein
MQLSIIELISKWFSLLLLSFIPFAFTENPAKLASQQVVNTYTQQLAGFPFNKQ